VSLKVYRTTTPVSSAHAQGVSSRVLLISSHTRLARQLAPSAISSNDFVHAHAVQDAWQQRQDSAAACPRYANSRLARKQQTEQVGRFAPDFIRSCIHPASSPISQSSNITTSLHLPPSLTNSPFIPCPSARLQDPNSARTCLLGP
jgi:hypothetical protein